MSYQSNYYYKIHLKANLSNIYNNYYYKTYTIYNFISSRIDKKYKKLNNVVNYTKIILEFINSWLIIILLLIIVMSKYYLLSLVKLIILSFIIYEFVSLESSKYSLQKIYETEKLTSFIVKSDGQFNSNYMPKDTLLDIEKTNKKNNKKIKYIIAYLNIAIVYFSINTLAIYLYQFYKFDFLFGEFNNNNLSVYGQKVLNNLSIIGLEVFNKNKFDIINQNYKKDINIIHKKFMLDKFAIYYDSEIFFNLLPHFLSNILIILLKNAITCILDDFKTLQNRLNCSVNSLSNINIIELNDTTNYDNVYNTSNKNTLNIDSKNLFIYKINYFKYYMYLITALFCSKFNIIVYITIVYIYINYEFNLVFAIIILIIAFNYIITYKAIFIKHIFNKNLKFHCKLLIQIKFNIKIVFIN